MDEIEGEGEGTNHIRQIIEPEKMDGSRVKAMTYIIEDRKHCVKTSIEYAQHILDGMNENKLPEECKRHVISQVIANNSELAQKLGKI